METQDNNQVILKRAVGRPKGSFKPDHLKKKQVYVSRKKHLKKYQLDYNGETLQFESQQDVANHLGCSVDRVYRLVNNLSTCTRKKELADIKITRI